MITHVHLMLKLMRGAISPLFFTPSWRGVSLSIQTPPLTLPSTSRSSNWALLLRFSDQNDVCISDFSHTCYMTCQPVVLRTSPLWALLQLVTSFRTDRNIHVITLSSIFSKFSVYIFRYPAKAIRIIFGTGVCIGYIR
jgi:hypothetical protein